MTTDFEKEAIKVMLQAGISQEHIQAQKRNFFQATPVENYYNKVENSETPKNDIPVDKIIAMKTTNPVEGKSVYELFMDKKTEGFEKQLKALRTYGLDAQRAFYASEANLKGPTPIRLNYYKEDDCYILQKVGRCRTIAAKMLGAPLISGVVTTYERDEKKKNVYEDYESLKEILRLTDLKGMTLDFFQEKKDSQKENR